MSVGTKFFRILPCDTPGGIVGILFETFEILEMHKAVA